MIKKLVISILICLVITLSVPITVSAIADPDSEPTINAVYVYEFDSGAVGVFMDYYLDYSAPYPDETVTEAYLMVFIDTDGVTQLKAVAPYTYANSGYTRGACWIYFTAAEVDTYSIDSADIANYRVWLTGNPTLAWAGDPPKTIGMLDDWIDTDTSIWLALRVLDEADALELAWTVDMVESTSLGNRLTSTGAEYFENVISGIRTLAPLCFADSVNDPDYVPVSYDTTYSAIATSGTGTVTGSPFEITEGGDTVTVSAAGTITVTLGGWTYGTFTDDTGTVTGSPVDLYPGANVLTVTVAGDFTADCEVVDSATIMADTVTGTGLDLTDVAAAFGMSRWWFSGLIWLIVSVVAVAMALFGSRRSETFGDGGSSKIAMYLFGVLMIGGALLGLLHPLVVSVLVIAYGAYIGYIIWFRSETLHKGFMFMIWMFVIVSIAGNVAAGGDSSITATRLTSSITAAESDSIPVASTVGFPDSGVIVIGDEQISYPDKDDTHFLDTTFNDIVRGSGGTTASVHDTNATVRTKESWILNAAVDYKIAQIVDSAGALDYIQMPARLLDLIVTFFILPLDFLGTDLAFLTYIWMVVAVGMVVGIVIQLVGGRRV